MRVVLSLEIFSMHAFSAKFRDTQSFFHSEIKFPNTVRSPHRHAHHPPTYSPLLFLKVSVNFGRMESKCEEFEALRSGVAHVSSF